MRTFLTKIEDFFASIANRLAGSKEKEEPDKAPGLLDRVDLFFARFDGSFLIWSFFLSFAVMLLVYVAMDVYPFGKSSVLVLDLNGQYVQFFAGLRDIFHGDGSLLYSFSRSLGGEYLGIFTYYLASPFSWLVVLFPEKNILEALLLMITLKAGCCGLTFGAFLHYTRRPPKTITVALSVLYALSSYMVVMQHNTMWIDAVMLLPLLLWGLERLVRYRKPLLYVASLALLFMTNYYTGYMVAIFTAIYFFYLFAAHASEEINPHGERCHFGTSILRVGVYTLIGIGISAILLLPAYYSLTFGKTDFANSSTAFVAKFDIIDFIAKMFPGAYDTVRTGNDPVHPAGLPWVYSGTLSLILLPLYFAAKRIPTREKAATGGLALLLFFSMYINTLDLLWHGGSHPNWLNCRYSFIFTFVILLMAARTLTHIKSVDYCIPPAVCGALVLFVIILQKLGLTYTSDGVTREFFDDLWGVWLSIGCLAVYCILLLFLTGHDRTSPRYEPIATLLVAVICIEVLLNGVFMLRRQHEDVIISSHDSYHSFYDVYKEPVDYVKETDAALFYRMDKSFQHYVTDSFVLGYNGLASSTSTLNSSVIAFQRYLGMRADSHWTEATGATVASGALLGVKYWITKEGDTVDPIYKKYATAGSAELGTATVTYQNPYALPLLFAAHPAIKDVNYAIPGDSQDYYDGNTLREEYEDALWSPFERLNATYAALTGRDDLLVYTPLDAEWSLTGGLEIDTTTYKATTIKSHTYLVNGGNANARLVFKVDAPADGSPIYFYMPTRYAREFTVYVNGEELYANKAESRTAGAQYPGGAAQASILTIDTTDVIGSLSVELYFPSDAFFLADVPHFYTIDEAALAEAAEILSAGGISLTVAKEHRFEGTLTAAEGFTTVQTTIPYDAGWRIYVDGERVEGYETLGAMLAFDLTEAGMHEITLRYCPSLYVLGLITTIVCFLIALAVLILINLQKRGKLRLEGGNVVSLTLLFFLPPAKGLVERPLGGEEPPARPMQNDEPPAPPLGGGLFGRKNGDAAQEASPKAKNPSQKKRK